MSEADDILLEKLEKRFEDNPKRHVDILWSDVSRNLNMKPDKLTSLLQMEETGGEPDVIGYDKETDEYIFCDCSAETPLGRRSICFDPKALNDRKENKPRDSAIGMADSMGIEMLSEEQYFELQKLGEFDKKTSSWVKTPESLRKLGGALFGDRRYGRVFIYHNGADSYYSVRGFRATLRV